MLFFDCIWNVFMVLKSPFKNSTIIISYYVFSFFLFDFILLDFVIVFVFILLFILDKLILFSLKLFKSLDEMLSLQIFDLAICFKIDCNGKILIHTLHFIMIDFISFIYWFLGFYLRISKMGRLAFK